MKIVLFFLFIFFGTTYGHCAGSLTIYLSKCRSECDKETGVLRVFKGRKLVKKSKTFKTEISNLEEGIYYVEYTSLVDKRRTLEVEIRKNEAKILTLCFDDFDYRKKIAPSKIDILPLGAELVISGKMGGRKNQVLDNIRFHRTSEAFFVEYDTNYRKMTEVEVEIIREFEYFLLHLTKRGWGGKKEKYTLTLNNEKIKRKVNTGWWNGFHYLLVDFKFAEKEDCQ
jgi:hypothetical protein